MRILYHVTLSPFSRKVRLVLAEKGLEFTLKFEKTWERRPEFLALNPAGEVPVLIEPDGAVVAGTEAVVEYLDEVYPDIRLIGATPAERAEIRRLVAWFDVKMNFEVTENLLGQKMMSRYRSPGQPSAQPSSQAIRAGHANLPYHLDYIGYLVERRRWLGGRPVLGRRHHRGGASVEPRLSRRRAVGRARAGQGMVRAHQVAPELPRDPGRPRPRRPAAAALRRSGFLRIAFSTDTPPGGSVSGAAAEEIPWGREFFRSGAGFCRFSPFRIETWRVSSRFPGAVNREADRAEQRIAATVQGAAAAEQRTPGTIARSHRVSTGRSRSCDCGNFSGVQDKWREALMKPMTEEIEATATPIPMPVRSPPRSWRKPAASRASGHCAGRSA